MSISRKRLNSEESRSASLEAARLLLLEQGPQAVTLKAVAAKVGRTHANLLHHFGSAAGLQAKLARSIADRVTGSIAEAVERARVVQAARQAEERARQVREAMAKQAAEEAAAQYSRE